MSPPQAEDVELKRSNNQSNAANMKPNTPTTAQDGVSRNGRFDVPDSIGTLAHLIFPVLVC